MERSLQIVTSCFCHSKPCPFLSPLSQNTDTDLIRQWKKTGFLAKQALTLTNFIVPKSCNSKSNCKKHFFPCACCSILTSRNWYCTKLLYFFLTRQWQTTNKTFDPFCTFGDKCYIKLFLYSKFNLYAYPQNVRRFIPLWSLLISWWCFMTPVIDQWYKPTELHVFALCSVNSHFG